MAWEDDDPEEESGSLAVANAMVGDSRGVVPEEQPRPLTPGQSEGMSDPSETDMLQRVEEPAPAQHAAVGDSSSAEEDGEQEMLQAAPQESAGSGRLRAPKLPSLPKYENAAAAHQQLERDMRSVNPQDYKPSIGRRIGASIASGMAAFGHMPGAGEMAQKIYDAPLDRARAAQASTVRADRQSVSDIEQRNAQARQQYGDAGQQFQNEERDMRNQGYVTNQNAQAEERRAHAAQRQAGPDANGWQPDDPANPLGGYHATSMGGKPLKSATPPPGVQKGNDYLIAKRRSEGTAQGLAGDDLKSYTLTGKIPTKPNRTNVHVPSAEAEKYNDWKSSFAHENGRQPNAAEIASFGHQSSGAMSKSLGDRIESQKNQQISKAQRDFNGGLIDRDEYLGQWQAAQDEYEQRLGDASGGDVPHVVIKDNVDQNGVWHGQAPAGPAAAAPAQAPRQAAPAQQSAPSAKKYTVGQSVKVDGKDYVVKGINPKTGKPIVGAP